MKLKVRLGFNFIFRKMIIVFNQKEYLMFITNLRRQLSAIIWSGNKKYH